MIAALAESGSKQTSRTLASTWGMARPVSVSSPTNRAEPIQDESDARESVSMSAVTVPTLVPLLRVAGSNTMPSGPPAAGAAAGAAVARAVEAAPWGAEPSGDLSPPAQAASARRVAAEIERMVIHLV